MKPTVPTFFLVLVSLLFVHSAMAQRRLPKGNTPVATTPTRSEKPQVAAPKPDPRSRVEGGILNTQIQQAEISKQKIENAELAVSAEKTKKTNLVPQFSARRGEALRTDDIPKIDGNLNDACWQMTDSVQVFTQFTQFSPNPGAPSNYTSEVKMTYDNRNIYIAAYLHDKEPRKIAKELTLRDAIGNDDYFAVYFDTYNDKQNAFLFGVTAAGVQIDGRVNGMTEDYSWNVVWRSTVKQVRDGWIVEMEIPYSAIRFPNRLRQKWNVNFRREVRRDREVSYWNAVNPSIDGMVQQFGTVDSVSYIRPAMRLSFTPYLATFSQNNPTPARGDAAWETKFTGGLDMKLGLGESTTLDMSIIPDFGQVQSDDVELNLTPFELRFDENRPFFTENTDIFRRGGLFYSRRIGGKPFNYNGAAAYVATDASKSVAYNPDRSAISNIVKLSGRDKNGLGFGILNGIHGGTFAEISRGKGLKENFLTDPRTNFNLIVVDKLLKNNSHISFTNANTIREGKARDANVTAADVRLATDDNQYAFTGNAAVSNVYSNDSLNSTKRGYTYSLGFSKINGPFRFDVGRTLYNDTYDPTDLGFLLTNNVVRNYATVRRVSFLPKGGINNYQLGATAAYQEIYDIAAYNRLDVSGFASVQFKNFLQLSANLNYVPNGINDYFEARNSHRLFKKPSEAEIGGTIETDSRRKVSALISGGYNAATDTSTRRSWYVGIEPRLRISNRFSLLPSVKLRMYHNEQGFAGYRDSLKTKEVFGTRERQEIVTTMTANYLFSPKSSFSVRARHYWSVVNYTYYHTLQDDGRLKTVVNPFDATTNPERNYNIFNLDFVYRWQFAPGSELNLIWKNSAFTDTKELVYQYDQNFTNVFGNEHNNSVSVKFLYYLDYLKIRKRHR